MVACWDTKYTYWLIRPFQLDPEFSPLFATPNHPSYPSAHSCISSAMSGVLAHLFPTDAAEVDSLAQEATESRLWGGIHYRIDLEAGTEIGENVAAALIERASPLFAP
jgi:membrane-associated phospholipid phosphatase